ncbi:MAG: hypothetical protein AMXMBFR34_08790 [Myxococcaceae bacterium]
MPQAAHGAGTDCAQTSGARGEAAVVPSPSHQAGAHRSERLLRARHPARAATAVIRETVPMKALPQCFARVFGGAMCAMAQTEIFWPMD